MEFWGFISVLIVSVFAFISVATWSENRRKERDSLYKSEMLRKLADQSAESADRVLQFLREEQLRKERRALEGGKLSAFILLAVGAVLTTFLAMIQQNKPVWMVGLFPLAIGAVLLFYSYVLATKPGE